MNISLTSRLESYIDSKVSSGLYHSSSEVVREALRLMIQAESSSFATKEALNNQIQIGLDQIEKGEYITDGQLKDHIKKRRQKRV